jgi:hypothetical protein
VRGGQDFFQLFCRRVEPMEEEAERGQKRRVRGGQDFFQLLQEG